MGRRGRKGADLGRRGALYFLFIQTSFTIVFAAGLGFIFNSDPDLISAVLILKNSDKL